MARDPFDSLLGELLSAHDRLLGAERPAAAPGWRGRFGLGAVRRGRFGLGAVRRGKRRRTLAVLAAGALLLTASATAAVVIVTSSQPLAGRLPQLLGTRYALRVSPDLQAGHAGWCVSLLDIRASEAVLPVPSACVSGRGPLIARGGIAVLSPKTGRERARLLYAIVDRRVAALRAPGGATIRPIASAELPSGWRAAVTLQAHPQALAQHFAGTVVTLSPLRAGGERMSTITGTPVMAPVRPVGAGSHRAGACGLQVRTWPGLRLGGAEAVLAPLPRTLPRTAGFLSCYSLSLDFGGSVSVAAVLVDAARPGSRVPVLPGFSRLRSHPRFWAGPATTAGGADTGLLQRLFARRLGSAWLVLETPASQAMALMVLDRISAAG